MGRMKPMSPAEIACMLQHGAHAWEPFESRIDYVKNHARHLWQALLYKLGRESNAPWLEWSLHEKCTNCGKKRAVRG